MSGGATLADAYSQRHNLRGVDSLRGVAAAVVVVGHAAGMLLATGRASPNVQFVINHFGLAVPLFFCLSGFVLTYGYRTKLEGRDQVLAFLARRFFRIAPLFYAMLGIWLLYWISTAQPVTPQNLFLNVSLLFGLVPGAQESLVPAGWTIGTEVAFYALFPVLIVFIRSWRSAIAAFALAAVSSAAAFDALQPAGASFSPSFAHIMLLTNLPYFLAGIGCYWIWERTGFARDRRGWWLFAAACVGAVLALTPAADAVFAVYPILSRVSWALIFGALMVATATARNPLLERGPLPFLGRISYSLYLDHSLVLVALSMFAWPAVRDLGFGASVTYAIYGAIALAAVTPVAYVTFRAVEAPWMAFGSALSKRIAGRATQAVAAPAGPADAAESVAPPAASTANV